MYMPWCSSGTIIVSSVDSWPPCSEPVEVKTPAGLRSSAPFSHSALVPSRKILERRRHVAETGRAAEDQAAAFAQVVMRGEGRAGLRHGGLGCLGDGRNAGTVRRRGAGPGDGLDAADDLPGQFGRRAMPRVVEHQYFGHLLTSLIGGAGRTAAGGF